MPSIKKIIQSLELVPHPEGGYYKEVHRSLHQVSSSLFNEPRSAYTAIYYLLAGTDFSAWHRIGCEETWLFHSGCDVEIHFFDEYGTLQSVRIGHDASNYQVTIAAHLWFAAQPVDPHSYGLVSCIVAPGFEFKEFELGKRAQLISEYGSSPKTRDVIEALTRMP